MDIRISGGYRTMNIEIRIVNCNQQRKVLVVLAPH